MTTLRRDDAGLVRTSTLDVPPDQVAGVVADLTRACEAVAGEPGRGLLASTVLVSRAMPGSEGAPVRVVHLARWASVALADAAQARLSPADAVASQGGDVRDLEPRGMCTADPEQQAELVEGGAATFLISMDSDPGQHERLLALNVEDTEVVFSKMPGFVASTFFSDRSRARVFEIVQWQTIGNFLAAASSPAFAEHDVLIQQLCHATDARPYDVVHTTEQSPWPPPAAQG